MKTYKDLIAARQKIKSKSNRVAIDPNNVMPIKCASCPWRKHGGVLAGMNNTRAALMHQVLVEQNQLCHAAAFTGELETRVCRGARDYQLNAWYGIGFLSAPTDKAWADKLEEISQNNQPFYVR